MYRLLLGLLSICCLLACTEDHLSPDLPKDSLAAYLRAQTDLPLQRDSLIACAAGGQMTFLEDADFPISVFFYPETGASDFRYFETTDINADPDDLRAYQALTLSSEPLFNGYLYRFLRPAVTGNTWCRVTYIRKGKTYISNAIRLKYDNLPTEFNPDLVTIDQTERLAPEFIWEDGRTPENVIYFHVIADEANNLVAGLYTEERRFQFYDLSNVVLNIRAIDPPPALLPDRPYRYVMMGVSLDNWVNLIIEKEFDTF